MESADVIKIGTNPLLTLTLCVGIMVGVIMTGSHFSQRHTAEREVQAAMGNTIAVTSLDR